MIKLEELSYNDKVVLTIELDENDKSIVLVDENKNTVRLGPSGISFNSNKDINISSLGNINISSVGSTNISSKADIKMLGLNINMNAQVSLNAKGVATAELSASGQTTVKGAMVMIN